MLVDPPVLALLRSVRRRLRIQAAVQGAAVAGGGAAGVALLGVGLWKVGVLDASAIKLLLAAAGVLGALGAAAAALRAIPLERVAKRVDQSHGLRDRLGSALAFAADPAPTAFMKAAIADAGAAAPRSEATRAAPFRRPRELELAGLLAALAAGRALDPFPPRS